MQQPSGHDSEDALIGSLHQGTNVSLMCLCSRAACVVQGVDLDCDSGSCTAGGGNNAAGTRNTPLLPASLNTTLNCVVQECTIFCARSVGQHSQLYIAGNNPTWHKMLAGPFLQSFNA
jgi:hypothetical protein